MAFNFSRSCESEKDGACLVGILSRGEPLRWGVDRQSIQEQRHAIHSWHEHVGKPLLSRLRISTLYMMAVDHRRGFDDMTYIRTLSNGSLPSSARVVMRFLNTSGQASNFMNAFALFRSEIRQTRAVVVARFDVLAVTDVFEWGCSSLDLWPWRMLYLPGWVGKANTVNDIYHIVPRKYYGVFDSVFFRNDFRNDTEPCFATDLPRVWQSTSGHFCYQPLVQAIGRDNVSVCQNTHRVKSTYLMGTHHLSMCNTLPAESKVWRCGGKFRPNNLTVATRR